MASAARSAVAPLYVFACLILGGSAQGVWQNASLQLCGIAIIAWAALEHAPQPTPRAARPMFLLTIAVVAVAAIQALPVPPSLWAYGPRARLLHDYRLLGLAPRMLPLSLTPYASLATLLCLIPPIATFCAIVQLRAHRPSWLAAALLTGAVLGVILGAVQISSPAGRSFWYLYKDTNVGLGVGFFANANHMATLLLMTIPFVAAMAAGRSRNSQRSWALLAVLTGAALILIVGLALTGSLAGFALSLPMLAASALIVLPLKGRSRTLLASAAALAVIAGVGALSLSSVGATRLGKDASSSVQSRQEILRTTAQAAADFMPFGSGLGSFINVYRLYERPETVTNEYVIHAHNDYAELALELGVPGIALILSFLVCWVFAVRAIWLKGEGGPYAQAAAIASAAVLVHTLVDFPARTAAISCCFALCLALLADRQKPQRQSTGNLRPTRHIVIR